jgi:hypothetical protein
VKLTELFGAEKSIEDLPVERNWKLISRSYSPPRKDAEALAKLGLTPTVLEKAMCGVTTYLWQDEVTGILRKEEMLGNDQDELAELVDKVEKSGMQYIRMNGNAYAIAKWVPPVTPQG